MIVYSGNNKYIFQTIFTEKIRQTQNDPHGYR